MEPNEIFRALMAAKDGKDGALRGLIQAIRDGEVAVELSTNLVTLRRAPRRQLATLAAALEALRIQAGLTQDALADTVGVSSSTVSRLLRAEALPSWPVVQFMVTTMGGAAAQVGAIRAMYDAALRERRQR